VKTVAREPAKQLHLMVVQEITWAKSGPAHKDNDALFLRNPNTNHKLGTTFLYVKKKTYQQ